MGLPKQLIPSPVLTSTVEIRFKSSVDKAKFLPLMIENFYKILPNFSETGIPAELKEENIQLKYFPDYILRNDEFSLSFSDKAISFENINGYKLWDNYFSFIKKILTDIYELKIFDSIDRIGIRYSSLFEHNGNTLDEIFTNTPKLVLDNYQGEFLSFSSNIFKNNCRLYLQLNSNHTALKEDKEVTGVHVDIDASYNFKSDDSSSLDPVCKVINDLHTYEKELFFSIIKPSFLERNFQIN